jgi:RNA 2',3'-cyclic 3'-phosphodiesterase
VRLFIAAWPPTDVLDAVEALDRPERAGVRWTTREQWHVTLRFLGAVDDVDLVETSLRGVGTLPSAASAGPQTTRLGRSLAVLPVSGLDRLAGAVVDLTASFGEPPDTRPFFGHITLARAKPGVKLGGLVGAPISASWPVTELALVASDLHPTGAKYTVVARFPLK